MDDEINLAMPPIELEGDLYNKSRMPYVTVVSSSSDYAIIEDNASIAATIGSNRGLLNGSIMHRHNGQGHHMNYSYETGDNQDAVSDIGYQRMQSSPDNTELDQTASSNSVLKSPGDLNVDATDNEISELRSLIDRRTASAIILTYIFGFIQLGLAIAFPVWLAQRSKGQSRVVYGTVNNGGLAPGPALLMANWTALIINAGPLIYTLDQADNPTKILEFGTTTILSICVILRAAVTVPYGWYDYAMGSGVPVVEPTVISSICVLMLKLKHHYPNIKGVYRCYSLIVVIFSVSSISALVVLAYSPYIILDNSLTECMDDAISFTNSNSLGLKITIVIMLYLLGFAGMITGMSIIVTRFEEARDFAQRSIKVYKTIALVYIVVLTIIVIADGFTHAGKQFSCAGYSINSHYGYYNYKLESYYDGVRNSIRSGGLWYRVQNMCQG